MSILLMLSTQTRMEGQLSREEFLAAAQDFLLGVEETELSKAFLGPLLD